MSAVTDTVYSKVNLNLDQFQSKIQVSLVYYLIKMLKYK